MQAATILRMKPRVKKELSITELDETLSYFRLSLEAREIARLVLVEGRKNQVVADQFGKSKAYVNEVVTKVYNGYITKVAKMPKGWVKREIIGPPDLIAKFEKLAEEALIEYRKSQQ